MQLHSLNTVVLFLIALITTPSAFAQTPPANVQEMLNQVSQAVRELNYRGRLTYEHSGKLEVMEVAHAVVDGQEYEKIYYLNGPERSLVKNGRKLSCDTAGGLLLSGKGLVLPNGDSTRLEMYYDYIYLGVERIAGRPSWLVQFVPKDDYRHSFIMAVDQDVYLPTQMLVVANGRKVLERLQYVSLETGVDLSINDFSNEENQRVLAGQCEKHSAPSRSAALWQPAWVPPGFVLSKSQYSEQDGFIDTYTDGLASFSVFSRPVSAQNPEAAVIPPATSIKKGATVIVMKLLSDVQSPIQVSVLGEIPSDTAKRVISSVQSVR